MEHRHHGESVQAAAHAVLHDEPPRPPRRTSNHPHHHGGSSPSPTPGGDVSPDDAPLPKRYTVILLTCLCSMMCYMQRVNLSVTIMPISDEFGYGDDRTLQGAILSSFFYGYLFANIPGGILAKRYGGKVVVGTALTLSTLCTFAAPLLAGSVTSLISVRVFTGLAQGVVFPAMHHLLAAWIPPSERSRALSLITSGNYIGNVLTFFVAPRIIAAYSWAAVFNIFGCLGFAWCLSWLYLIYETPETHPDIRAQEVQLIQGANKHPQPKKTDIDASTDSAHHRDAATVSETPSSAVTAVQIGYLQMVRIPSVLVLLACNFCSGYGYYVILTWMPTYFRTAVHVPLEHVGFYSLLPYVVNVVSAIVGGQVSDYLLIQHKYPLLTVRKIMQAVGFIGPAIFVHIFPQMTTASGAATMMALCLGCYAWTLSGMDVVNLDIGGRHYAGTIKGLCNTVSTLAGTLSIGITGKILDVSDSWQAVFNAASVTYVIGAFLFLQYASIDRVDAPASSLSKKAGDTAASTHTGKGSSVDTSSLPTIATVQSKVVLV